MVAVLLSRLHDARRVDGAGGDGGRDAYFTDSAGQVHAFEMKSFTGRLTSSRRRQVKHSLDRALLRSPATWTLVVPIDFNDTEQAWFDGLRTACPNTTLDWRGRTWLQDELAAHPDIGRYFGGAASEVVTLLASIAQEQAQPKTVAQVADRMRVQAARLNEIDPYYSFDVRVEGDRTVVTTRAKYPGAERDRPIKVTTSLRFDESPESQATLAALEDHLAFGSRVILPASTLGEVVIDAPGGLGGTFAGGELILDGAFDPAPDAAVEFVLRTPIAGPGTTLRLQIVSRNIGQRGMRTTAVDPAKMLDLDLRADFTRNRFDANLHTHSKTAAAADVALPTLQFLRALAEAGELAILTPDGARIATAVGDFDRWGADPEYVDAVALLAEAQRLAGVYFPPPPEFTGEDLDDLDHSVRLLRGESLSGSWTGHAGTLEQDAAKELLEQLATLGDTISLFTRTPQWLDIGGGRIPLGVVEEVRHSARLVNRAEMEQAIEAPEVAGSVRVVFAPGNNSDVTIRMCDAEPPPDSG